MITTNARVAMLLVRTNFLLGQTPLDPLDKAILETDLNNQEIKQWIRENLTHEAVEQIQRERHAASLAASA